jgi:endonuclease YncB( thermonuclease family)
MRRLSLLLFVSVAFSAPVEAARCTGSANCRACTNCSRCAYCKGGGTCGVCASGRSASRPSPSIADEPTTKAENTSRPKPKGDCCTRVIASDVIEVTKADGKSITVRLLGVENLATRAAGEAMAELDEHATSFTRLLILDEEVRLESEPAKKTDESGRLLAYVYRVEDGKLLNRDLLTMGLVCLDARYTGAKIEDFRAAEREAKARFQGVWGAIHKEEETKLRAKRAKVANENRARSWLTIGDNLRANNVKAARKWYEDIVKKYPDTPSAETARSRLRQLGH